MTTDATPMWDGTLATALNCIEHQKRHNVYRDAQIAVVIKDANVYYLTGQFVLVSSVNDKTKSCTIEKPMTPEWLAKNIAERSLISTVGTTIGFPLSFLKIEPLPPGVVLAARDAEREDAKDKRIAELTAERDEHWMELSDAHLARDCGRHSSIAWTAGQTIRELDAKLQAANAKVAELKAEVERLKLFPKWIVETAVWLQIIDGCQSLTGPQVLHLCDCLFEEFKRLRAELADRDSALAEFGYSSGNEQLRCLGRRSKIAIDSEAELRQRCERVEAAIKEVINDMRITRDALSAATSQKLRKHVEWCIHTLSSALQPAEPHCRTCEGKRKVWDYISQDRAVLIDCPTCSQPAEPTSQPKGE